MLKLRRPSMLNTLIVLSGVTMLIGATTPIWLNIGYREHVAEAMKDADAMKMVVLEAATVHGGLAEVRATDLHYNAAASLGTYVSHAEIADGGLITLHTRDTGINPDPVLMFIPSEKNGKEGAEITWTCKQIAGNGPLAPPNCLSQDPLQNRSALTPGNPAADGSIAPSTTLAHASLAH